MAFVVLSLLFANTFEISRETINNFIKRIPPVYSKTVKVETFLYEGDVSHIFFHSLVVYPDLAFKGNYKSESYKDYMISRDEFLKILPELYKNNFVLIDIKLLYSVGTDGKVTKNKLFLPKDKKPLIISLDDLSYYRSMNGHGFANKLVLDKDGRVATQIKNLEGKTEITRDGDVVPILDDFVLAHPDFSFNGAKGIIATTGYEGVLGYRTDIDDLDNYPQDSREARKVIEKLKKTGWQFASHSYAHNEPFLYDTISLTELQNDIDSWNKEVRPLVGDTDVFIGPFGQIFQNGDDRRALLVKNGFKMLCGVGMDGYLNFYPDYAVMNRADIDGYRIKNSPELLKKYFDTKVLSGE